MRVDQDLWMTIDFEQTGQRAWKATAETDDGTFTATGETAREARLALDALVFHHPQSEIAV